MTTVNTPENIKLDTYPMRQLKEVANRVGDYQMGDICLTNNFGANMGVRVLETLEDADALMEQRRKIDISKRNWVVIRTNEQLDAALLAGWLDTPHGQQAIKNEHGMSTSGSFSGRRFFRWEHIGSLNVPVPPLEVQAEQKMLLDMSVGWMDEHIANIEKLANTLQKLRDVMADRIVRCGSDRKEVSGWLRDMLKKNPMLSKNEKGDDDNTSTDREPKLSDTPEATTPLIRPKGP
jgi:hypothetical protein